MRKAQAEQILHPGTAGDTRCRGAQSGDRLRAGRARRDRRRWRSVAGGTELRPTRPLVLDIAGVGQVTITPVAAVDLADVQADLDAHRSELSATLSLMGVADLDAAREGLARRRDFEAQRTSRLQPSGVARARRPGRARAGNGAMPSARSVLAPRRASLCRPGPTSRSRSGPAIAPIATPSRPLPPRRVDRPSICRR